MKKEKIENEEEKEIERCAEFLECLKIKIEYRHETMKYGTNSIFNK